MIKGLYEAHLPVSNLKRSIEFYRGLGLEFDHQVEDNLAFLWIEGIEAGWGSGTRIKSKSNTIRRSGTSLLKYLWTD